MNNSERELHSKYSIFFCNILTFHMLLKPTKDVFHGEYFRNAILGIERNSKVHGVSDTYES